ncbi:MAG: PAS domain S-box protein, partial [Methanoregulaceae archaeon]|nr:PAS domain S-box protein [Methanoregulaceae archaeon]
KKAGYDPIFRRVETREDFLAYLDPSLEVILADYSMPQFDALLALSLLQEKGFDIPFIVVTGAIGDEIAIECMKQGASDYLLKDRMARLGIAVSHAILEKRLREEKRQTDASLITSEEKFRTLFNNASDGIIIHDLDARILEVNRVTCERLGYSRDELLLMSLMDIESPDYAAMVKGKIQELLIEKHLFFEGAHISRDGSIIPIELSSRLIQYEGQPAVLSITRDITIRKRAEEALKRLNEELEARVDERTRNLQEEIYERKKTEKALDESRRMLVTLLSNLPGMAYRRQNRSDWPMEFVSDGCFLLTGYEPEELSGGNRFYGDLIHPKDRDMVWSSVQKAIEQKRPFTITYRITCADNTEKWVWEQGCGVFDSEETLLALEGFIIDTTERKLREYEIKEKAHQLAVINDIVTTISPTQPFQVIFRKSMDRLSKHLGFDLAAVFMYDPRRREFECRHTTGNPILESFSTKFHTIRIDNVDFAPLLFHRRALYFEGSGILSDLLDSGLKSAAAVPIRTDSKVVGIIFVGRLQNDTFDETDKAILEALGEKVGRVIEEATLHAELKRLHEEANLYLDILVHDINDANTRSFGYIDILTEMLNGKLKEYALTTRKGIEESIEIIRKVTLIRRIREKTTELAPVDLDAIIRTEMLRNRNITLFYEKKGILVMADDLLSEIFANLLGNSVTFGGPFVTIWVNAKQNGETVTVTVSDNGPGIPDPVKPKLFVNSQKGTSRGNAKGLGLYIVKMLLDRYGGKIKVSDRVENDPSQGVAMTFTLKAVQENNLQ